MGEGRGASGAEGGDEAIAVAIEVATDGFLDVGVDVRGGQAGGAGAELGDDEEALGDGVQGLVCDGGDGFIELGVALGTGADLADDGVDLAADVRSRDAGAVGVGGIRSTCISDQRLAAVSSSVSCFIWADTAVVIRMSRLDSRIDFIDR